MWKWFIFNAVLFYGTVVAADELYRRKMTDPHLSLLMMALLFAALHHFLARYVTTIEFFNYMPDSRPVPPCPPGSERGGKNGMDCKSVGDKYGL
jgi:hypothetical protein